MAITERKTDRTKNVSFAKFLGAYDSMSQNILKFRKVSSDPISIHLRKNPFTAETERQTELISIYISVCGAFKLHVDPKET